MKFEEAQITFWVTFSMPLPSSLVLSSPMILSSSKARITIVTQYVWILLLCKICVK